MKNDEADMLHRDVQDLTELHSGQDLKGFLGRVDRDDGGVGHKCHDLARTEQLPGLRKTGGIGNGLLPEFKILLVPGGEEAISFLNFQETDCPSGRDPRVGAGGKGVASQKDFLDRPCDKLKNNPQHQNRQDYRPAAPSM